MSLKSFREEFIEHVHSLLWRQWTRLGVAGPDVPESGCITDPEALLLFTFEVGRSEPRLYDEVLEWLSHNERLVNIQRLRNLISQDSAFDFSLAAAPARWLCTLNKTSKWRDLAKLPVAKTSIPFFTAEPRRTKSLSGAFDPLYKTCGWARPPIRLRGFIIEPARRRSFCSHPAPEVPFRFECPRRGRGLPSSQSLGPPDGNGAGTGLQPAEPLSAVQGDGRVGLALFPESRAGKAVSAGPRAMGCIPGSL